MRAKKEGATKELNFKEGEKVMISPIGEVVGADGRTFVISPDIIKNIKTHIPLDENHNGGRALGWFDKSTLEVREDGIYATLELNDEGRELIEKRAYRYLSPVFVMSDARVVEGIDSVGLVNTPNLLFRELNNKTKTKKEQKEMSDAEFQAALAQKDKTIAELEAKVKELEALVAKSEANAKKMKVEKLVAEGALLEEQKELALEMNDRLLDAFVEQNKRLLAMTNGRLSLQKNTTEVSTLSDSEILLCKRLGISTEEYLKNKGDK